MDMQACPLGSLPAEIKGKTCSTFREYDLLSVSMPVYMPYKHAWIFDMII